MVVSRAPLVLVFACVAVVFAAVAVGCGSTSDQPTPTVTVTETATASTPAGSPSGDVVTLAEAKQAALDKVGGGVVTWSGPENDRGAAWEIEVTRPDGTEVDVLIAADGSVVKQVPRYRSSDAPDNSVAAPSSKVSRAEAEAAALAAVGEGRVTWSGREDDRGAAWEIEITRADGSEVDVLIAADGSVID